jgi:hypothetical protein
MSTKPAAVPIAFVNNDEDTVATLKEIAKDYTKLPEHRRSDRDTMLGGVRTAFELNHWETGIPFNKSPCESVLFCLGFIGAAAGLVSAVVLALPLCAPAVAVCATTAGTSGAAAAQAANDMANGGPTGDLIPPSPLGATRLGVAADDVVLFHNVHPEDVPGAFQRVAPDVAAARTGRYVYVVTEDGRLVIGRAGRAGHVDLANGQPVQAAGEFTTKGGEVVSVTNASGHYLPTGASAQQAALDAMRARGLNVTGPYSEVGG